MTTSRPARALRGAVVVLAVAVTARVPAVIGRFRQAVADAEQADGRSAVGLAALPAHGRDAPPATVRIGPPARGESATVVGDAAPAPLGATVRLPARGDEQPALVDVTRGDRERRARAPQRRSAHLSAIAVATAAPSAVEAAGSNVAPTGAIAVAATPMPPVAATPVAPAPFDLATAAYAKLAAGDRRGAVQLFDATLTGDDPRSDAWRRQRDALTRHWSGSAYSIVRASGSPGSGTEPVLGGGQSGGGLAYTLDPLDRRPVALTARGSIAHDDAGRSGFVAVGVEWRPLAGVHIAAERLIAVGPEGLNAWSLRLAAGGNHRIGRIEATGYAEGGLIGGAAYAAAQGRVAGLVRDAGVTFAPGVGLWSSLQHDRGRTVDRVDLGPGVVVRAAPLAVEVDYRVRVAGDAAPGSGPVLTVSAAF